MRLLKIDFVCFQKTHSIATMTHNNHAENLSMMDAVTTKYGKTTFVTVSKTLAIILLVIFFICLVATGLLVYSFTSICSTNDTNISLSETSSVSPLCDNNNNNVIVSDSNLESQKATQAALTTTSTTSPPKTNNQTNKSSVVVDIRLPRYIVPDAYQIHLIPFIQENNFTFHGEETILINVTEVSSNITMHADALIIDAVNVMNINNESISVKDVRIIRKTEFLVIDLDGVVEAGQQYYVYIKFRGVLNDMLEGFYRSSYVENNSTR